jgi:hypothetical protein
MFRFLSFLAAAILLAAPGAEAAPIGFDAVRYDLQGEATVSDGQGGTLDTDSFQQSPAAADLPLLRDAAAIGAHASAFGQAGAELGFLQVGTESVPAGGETAEAFAVAVFSGDFTSPGGTLLFWLDLDAVQVLTGAGSVELVFSVTGLAPESLLLDTGIGTPISLMRSVSLAAGATGTLDLQLTASAAGGAFNQAGLGFRLETAPEPGVIPEIDGLSGTAALTLLAGAIALAGERRRRAEA